MSDSYWVLYRGKGNDTERITAGSFNLCDNTRKIMEAQQPDSYFWVGEHQPAARKANK